MLGELFVGVVAEGDDIDDPPAVALPEDIPESEGIVDPEPEEVPVSCLAHDDTKNKRHKINTQLYNLLMLSLLTFLQSAAASNLAKLLLLYRFRIQNIARNIRGAAPPL